MTNITNLNTDGNNRVFYDNFRRALLMHRKGRLEFFAELILPKMERHQENLNLDLLNKIDFRVWLTPELPDLGPESFLYLELKDLQESLLSLSEIALHAHRSKLLTRETLDGVMKEMFEFEKKANQLMTALTISLTDIDQLTGLLNRSAMERDLADEFEILCIQKKPLTLAMIDLDHFKKVNDDYGHLMGDQVLQQMAERFVENLRPQDRIYRYGGEEFLVILPNTSTHDAQRVLEKLRCMVFSSPIKYRSVKVIQTVSIGIAQVKSDELHSNTIERADSALYKAKNLGRNRVICAD